MTETDMSVRRLPNTIYIARGAHAPGDPTAGSPACTMEWASWLAGEEEWSDHPECTHPVITGCVHVVNDRLDDGPRQRLAELIPSLVGTADHRGDPLARQRLSVRLAAWAAEQVLHHLPTEGREVCEQAIAAARAWADDPTEGARAVAQAAYAAARAAADYTTESRAAVAISASHAAQAAAAPVYDYVAPAYTYAADAAAQAAAATDDPVGLLRDLIVEHTRLTTQEG